MGAGQPTFTELPGAPGEGEVSGCDTSRIDLIDRRGNIVAAMPSGGWLSSRPVEPELGFGVGTRLQTPWFRETLADAVCPACRLLAPLSPTLPDADSSSRRMPLGRRSKRTVPPPATEAGRSGRAAVE